MKEKRAPDVSARPSVLILAESSAEAEGIAATLGSEFSRIQIGRPENAGAEVDRTKPDVVIFGFRSIHEAEERHTALQQSSEHWWEGTHSQIVLVHRDQVREAYALCDRQIFDDYVLYWPQPYDALHLRLAVTQGARRARAAAQRVRLPPELAETVRGSRAAGRTATQAAHEMGSCLTEAVGSLAHDARAARASLRRAEKHLSALRGAIADQAQAWHKLRGWAGDIKQRVLIVEDDPYQQHLLAHLFEAENFEVHLAATGADALASVRHARPDLVLCEFQLSDIDGATLTRRLKMVSATKEVPVIIITGHSNRAVVVESIQAGAADFLVKPLASDVVRQRITTRVAGRGSSLSDPNAPRVNLDAPGFPTPVGSGATGSLDVSNDEAGAAAAPRGARPVPT